MAAILSKSVCPACPTHEAPIFVENHFDRVGGREYKIVRCAACGVVYSLPREMVGADWYEKASPIRALEHHPPPEQDWRYRMFFGEQLPPGKLLDVGCGDGNFLLLAKARGFSVVGFDYEKRMIDLARSRGITDAHVAEFSEFCRSRSESEFDFITMFDVLEHTPEPGWFLGELKRLLRVGGHVVITLPNARRPLPWRREDHDFPPHHFTRWSAAVMRSFLKRNGFEVVHQDAGTLKLKYMADHFFFYALMPGLLSLARGFLFGNQSRTISELYAEQSPPQGPAAPKSAGLRSRLKRKLSDKLFRQHLVNGFKTACSVITYPTAAAMMTYYQVRQNETGDCLYTIAKLIDKSSAPEKSK